MYQTLYAAASPPAAGAALDQVIGLSATAGVVSVVLLGIAYGHRTGKIEFLDKLSNGFERRTGTPGWASLPIAMVGASLLIALIGFVWDVSLHAGRGRDEGPLANPSHYFILFGLFVLFVAGCTAIILPKGERPGDASVRITRRWYAPVGGILIAGAGFYALIGFPLDDVWHRIFGQDVTLWGPTHLMLIGGAGLATLGIRILEIEGHLARKSPLVHARTQRFFYMVGAGAFLLGLSVFHVEFDFGIQQFRQVLEPMMITGAAAIALVYARLNLGRGGAIGAAIACLAIRGVVAVAVGPVLGEADNLFPLYLGTAFLIEIVALTTLVKKPLVFGAVAGFVASTLGLITESFWIDAFYQLPWTQDMWLEGLLMSIPVGILGGMVGALIALGFQGKLPSVKFSGSIMIAFLIVTGAATANGLNATVPKDASAHFVLEAVDSGPDRTVNITVTLSENTPITDSPTWIQVTAWQGGGVVVDRLRHVEGRTYETTRPIPVTGNWKTLLRIHEGRTLAAAPIYLPLDEAINADEVPAEADMTREFVPESTLLQRERNLDVPAWLWTASCLVVLLCTLALIWALAWGVARINRAVAKQNEARAANELAPK